MPRNESMLLSEPANQSFANQTLLAELGDYWESSPGDVTVKLQNFTKYVRREDISKFLMRNEVFRKQLKVHGSIVDLGVARGASLMTWFHLSSIYEPTNYSRRIIGFDTFSGIPNLDEADLVGDGISEYMHVGGFRVEPDMKEDIEESVRLHDQTRYLHHIPKAQLVQGDIEQTLPQFLAEHPYLVVSLLNIDVDVYRPTRVALELLLPRMPRGAVIIFDELALNLFPGETAALQDVIGIANCRLRRFNFAPASAYLVVE